MTVKQRGRGRPATGQNPMIGIRWSPEMVEGIDRYALASNLNRPDALREIVAKFLSRKGLLTKRNNAEAVR